MRPRDIRRRESADLEQEALRLREEVLAQRFHGQSEEKVDRGRAVKNRRDIARIKTILRERTLGVNVESGDGLSKGSK